MSLLLAIPVAGFAQYEDDDEAVADTNVVRIQRKAKKVEPTREITGRVVSQQDHAPLAGVLVQSTAGEGYSCLTEEDGSFKVNVPLYASALDVTIPGYNKVRVGLNKSGKLRDIVMQSEAAQARYHDDDNVMGHGRIGNFDHTYPGVTSKKKDTLKSVSFFLGSGGSRPPPFGN